MALTRPRIKQPRITRPRVSRAPARTNTPSLEALTIGAQYDIALHNPNAQTIPTGSLTAAALTVQQKNSQDIRRLVQPWQAESMSYYHLVPEHSFATRFMAQMLSKVRLFPARLDPDTNEPEEITSGVEVDLLARIQDRSGSRSELQRSYAALKYLIGEVYLTATPDRDREEVWECLSPNELRVQPQGIASRFRAPMLPADQYIIGNDAYHAREYGGIVGPAFSESGPDIILVYRMWRPSPAYSWLADCSSHANLGLLEELVLSTLSVKAQLKSRLNTVGAFLIPEEASLPSDGNDPDEDPMSDLLQQRFTEAIMASIKDPGAAAAMAPIVVQMAGEFIKDAKLIRFNDNAGELTEIAQRGEMVERYGIGAELPPELFKSQTDLNHWPCDEQTEVFTEDRGFVTHDALSTGDIVLSLNHETGLSEWVPLSGVRREHVEDREMVRVLTANVDALTTPEHKWPIFRGGERVWTSGAGLQPADRIIKAVPHAELPNAKTYADEFVEVVAWFITEGTCTEPTPGHHQVRIGQSHEANPGEVARISETLTGLYGAPVATLRRPPGIPRGSYVKPAWRADVEERGMTLFNLNKTAYQPILDVMEDPRAKIVSRNFVRALTHDQLVLFLGTCARGDGNLTSQGGLDINQRSSERLAPMALAAILAGRPISFAISERSGGFKEGTQHHLRVPITRGYDVPCGETTRETYTGVIFCPKVPPTSSFLARRNGKVYFTGNTGWLVDKQTYDNYGDPAAREMASDINAAYFQPACRDAGVKDWKTITIGVDPAEAINHPNRSKDALDLFDRLLINGEVTREQLGYNTNDAMSQAEKDEQAGLKIKDGSLYRFGIPAVRANIEPEAGEVEGAPAAPGEPAVNPATGGKAPPGPPKEGVAPPPSGKGPSAGPDATSGGPAVTASAAPQTALLALAQAAVHRARDVAGVRLRARAGARGKECVECQDAIRDLPNWDVAAVLGAEQAAALGVSPADLVEGSAGWFAAMVEADGVSAGWAAELGAMVEQHAAAGLFEAAAPALPDGFVRLLARVHLPLERG